MKRLTKRLLLLLVTLAALAGLMATAAFAADISKVEITGVTAPATGATASFDWTIPTDKGYSKWKDSAGNTCQWVETDSVPTTYAQLSSGKSYYKSDKDTL